MRKAAAFLGLATLLAMPGVVLAEPAVVDSTYGGLAVKAMAARDFEAAVKQLRDKSPDGLTDAARLINLGNAYAGLRRYDAARKAYMKAQRSPEQILLLANGSEASSRAIAERALSRLGTVYASR